MKFNKVKEFDSKTICPSLHDDPAFSVDPHSNPYSVTGHNSWPSPPPRGHPVLKNKKIASNDTVGPDADFHLIQPPNSPVIPSDSNPSPQHSSHGNHNKLPISASSMNQASVMSQGDSHSSLPTSPKKENKRMNFLSRRQSAQPRSIKSFFSSIGKKDRHRSELPNISDDTTLSSIEKKDRRHSELPIISCNTTIPPPIQHTEVLPPSTSEASKDPRHRGQLQDLDQVDELDETNPWGIPIHHDGPYEAANVQLNKRGGSRVPLGFADNGLYNIHALQANAQTYIPPQVPTGMSLNLSPGQILPRHFHVPFIQPASITTSSFSGRCTPMGPLLTPPHEPQYTATSSNVESGSKFCDNLLPIPETVQHSNNLSFNIGMAMLEPEDNATVPSPRVFLSQALPNEQGFDPCDSKIEHRQVPSHLVSAQAEPSCIETSQHFQNTSFTSFSSNKPDAIRPVRHSQNDSGPPMYNEQIDNEDASQQPLNETPSKEQQQLQSSSQSSQTSQNPASVASTGLQQHSNKSDNGSPPNDVQDMSFIPSDTNLLPPPAIGRDQLVVVQGTQHMSRAQTSSPSLHPRPDFPSPSVKHGNELDVQSTHYSTSTYASSQSQNSRKPPPRHLPKRLVMPTPLNTGSPPNTTASLHIGRVPQSHISPHDNFQPLPFNQHYLGRSPLGNLPMTPMHHQGNSQAEDVPIFGGRKLRKRASMLDTPTPAPVITTVSFAPPIIGFHHNAPDEKVMAHPMTEKTSKRLLSKRKT